MYQYLFALCFICAINGFTVKRISPISVVSNIRFESFSTKSRSPFDSKFQLFDKSKITRENEDNQFFESEFDKQPLKER